MYYLTGTEIPQLPELYLYTRCVTNMKLTLNLILTYSCLHLVKHKTVHNFFLGFVYLWQQPQDFSPDEPSHFSMSLSTVCKLAIKVASNYIEYLWINNLMYER